MGSHRVTSIEVEQTARAPRHRVVTAVETVEVDGPHRWTIKDVLNAMNRAERFFSQAPNGRQARVQRYECVKCRAEHIRTHVSDGAIHDLATLERRTPAARKGPAMARAAR